MAVKCLNQFEQEAIATSFSNKRQSIDELALQFRRSRRTIIRVLEDKGIDPGIRRRQELHKPASIPPVKVPRQVPVVIPTKTPWYRRIVGSIGGLFA